MSSFRISNVFTSINRDKVSNGVTNFDISEYNVLYQDSYMDLIWNPLYLQPQFMMKTSNPNSDNLVRGGYDISNSEENLSFSFQFPYNTIDEYFFSSSDGSEANVNLDYNFKLTWNRATLWLKSEFNTDFPYYEIDIKSVSSNAIVTITKYEL